MKTSQYNRTRKRSNIIYLILGFLLETRRVSRIIICLFLASSESSNDCAFLDDYIESSVDPSPDPVPRARTYSDQDRMSANSVISSVESSCTLNLNKLFFPDCFSVILKVI